MTPALLSLALKKSALVLHALALKLEDPVASKETLSLVAAVSEAANYFETQKIQSRKLGYVGGEDQVGITHPES